MVTWKDVGRTLLTCAAVLFLVLGLICLWEMHQEVRSLRADVEDLKLSARPLVSVNGKYPHIVTTRGEVVIQNEEKANDE